MPWKKGERIPTNLITGFLGSGKTTAISHLINQRPEGEQWSVMINEFGSVSIDHALLDSDKGGVAVEELGGGCACCTLAMAFKPLLARFLRQTKPDRFILEPSGLSHPAKVVDILRGDNFSGSIDLRNIICLVDPKDFENPRWQNNEVFQDQIQLADIVVLNWSDCRDVDQIKRCRDWIDSFDPPKQMVVETSFGEFSPELLDMKFDSVRMPLFENAHPKPVTLDGHSSSDSHDHVHLDDSSMSQPTLGEPLRFQETSSDCKAFGWVFHLDEVFDRERVVDLLGRVDPIMRLKGIFRCQGDWWLVNRAKDGIQFKTSTYRRDSRLEILADHEAINWDDFEKSLLACILA